MMIRLVFHIVPDPSSVSAFTKMMIASLSMMSSLSPRTSHSRGFMDSSSELSEGSEKIQEMDRPLELSEVSEGGRGGEAKEDLVVLCLFSCPSTLW